MTLDDFVGLARRTAADLADARGKRQALAEAQTASVAADAQYMQDRVALAAALENLYPTAPDEASDLVQTPAPEGTRSASGPSPAAAAPQALLGLDNETIDLTEQMMEQMGPAAWPLVRRLLRRFLS